MSFLQEKHLNIAEFIAKWKKADLKERSAAQEHFIDLRRALGHPTPAEADPSFQTRNLTRLAIGGSMAATMPHKLT